MQAMHVNDRIVVAANKDGSLRELVKYLRDAVESELRRAKKRKSKLGPINPFLDEEIKPKMYRSLYLTQKAKKEKKTRKSLEDREFKFNGSSNVIQGGYDSASEEEKDLSS